MPLADKDQARLSQPATTRKLVFISCLLGFAFFAVFFKIPMAFDQSLAYVGLISGIFHLFLFIFFNKIFPINKKILSGMSLFNILLLGAGVHFTGGILSPFTFLFITILISDAANGIDYPNGLAAALITYLFVVGGEYLGLLSHVPVSTTVIYQSGITTALIVATMVFYIFVTGQTYKKLMKTLAAKLRTEEQNKEKMIKHLSRLEAPSQVGLLVQKIAHDLKGPLGAVSGFIKIMKSENTLTSESEEDCNIILVELNRINNLLNRMVSYIKPGHIDRAKICPVDLIETVLAIIQFDPQSQGIRFEKSFPDTETLFVWANKEELQQVYFNLLKNALEALQEQKEERRITLSIHVIDSAVCISIEDNGPGIPANFIETVGREFHTTKKDGTGLGLVIVKDILTSHNGRLEINSVPTQGTTIETWLPLYTNKSKKENHDPPKHQETYSS